MTAPIRLQPIPAEPIRLAPTHGLPVRMQPVEPDPIRLDVVAGLQGPPGPPGPAGAARTFVQAQPSSTWTIAHNLGRFPAVTLYTVGGVQFLAAVINLSPDVCQVLLDEPLAGKAIYV